MTTPYRAREGLSAWVHIDREAQRQDVVDAALRDLTIVWTLQCVVSCADLGNSIPDKKLANALDLVPNALDLVRLGQSLVLLIALKATGRGVDTSCRESSEAAN